MTINQCTWISIKAMSGFGFPTCTGCYFQPAMQSKKKHSNLAYTNEVNLEIGHHKGTDSLLPSVYGIAKTSTGGQNWGCSSSWNPSEKIRLLLHVQMYILQFCSVLGVLPKFVTGRLPIICKAKKHKILSGTARRITPVNWIQTRDLGWLTSDI